MDAPGAVDDLSALIGRHAGMVSAFDEAAGLGEITLDSGAPIPFHCVEIADGSRTIPVGTPVRCSLVAGNLGRVEATEIERAPD